MSWVSAWEITYYDSASVEYTACRKVAGAVLEALGLSADDLPHRKNNRRQQHLACGFWVLYWLEEHCRRQRGEPAWGLDYDLAARIKLVTGFKRKLQEHQEKAGKQEAAHAELP